MIHARLQRGACSRGGGQRVVREGLEFLHVRQAPIAEAAGGEAFGIRNGRIPSHGWARRLRPHEACVQIGDGAIAVVLVVVSVCGLLAANVAGMVAEGAGRRVAERLGLWLGTKPTARVAAPDVGRAIAEDVTRPPVVGGSRRVVGEIGRVQRGVRVVVIEDAEKLARGGQTPVGIASGAHGGGVCYSGFPSALAVIYLLPHEAGHVIGDRAVAVVGEGLGIDGVV